MFFYRKPQLTCRLSFFLDISPFFGIIRGVIIKVKHMIIGSLVIFLGIILLLRNLGIIELPTSVWSIFYPLVFIVVGIYMIIGTRKGREWGSRICGKFSGKDQGE